MTRFTRLALVFFSATFLSAQSTAPAVFRVTDQVVNPNPGAFTVTTVDRRILVDYNYEPMVWRNNRFVVTRDAVGRVYANQLAHFDSYAQGYWDGAELRLLRAADGKISQRLEGRVKRFHHGEWNEVSGNLIPSDRSQATYQFEDWSKPGQEWWLTLVAVDRQGRESAQSSALRVTHPGVGGQARAKIENAFSVSGPRIAENPSGTAPAAPADFRAEVNPANDVISLSWTAPVGELAGFRLYRSHSDPSTHNGTWLEMDTQNGGDRFAFKRGDLLFLSRRATEQRRDFMSPRIYNTPAGSPPDFAPRFQAAGSWQSAPHPFTLVPHPGTLPSDVDDAGETCMRIESNWPGTVSLRKYNHADTTQNWYQVLDPAKTYVVEVLARQEGLANPALRFHLTGPLASDVTPVDFPLTGEWQAFRAEFTVSRVLTGKGTVGQMGLQFEGPGTVWIDNFRVYDTEGGLLRHPPADRAAFRESGMSSMRTHDTIKTQGYTLDNLLGHPRMGLNSGDRVFSRANLSGLLREYKEMGIFPWLQIEFTLSEQEWRDLVEYLAAPYDPAVDTPESKPWAWRRVRHGQAEPYTRVFPRILFEFSNENWNPIMPIHFSGVEMMDEATGQVHGGGAVNGMMQEYTIQLMKSSPYWTPDVERVSEFVLGGWSINSFGYEGARMSPSSKHVLVADYNGGWDAGEGPETVGDLDAALRKTLIFGAQHSLPNAIRLREVRDRFESETGIRTELGTYEAGPGYNIDGLNGVRMTMEMVEFENRVMKSLAAGSSTLDCFLNQAAQGARLQNFFTFSRNRNYWTSHAEARNGGQAYPSWLALSLYNNHGQGDFLAVLTESVPTREAPAVGRRAPMPRAPETAVFATRNGDRLAVFVISRSLDSPTQVGLRLPVTSARRLTLHTLTGDPRANNLDAENVRIASRELPAELATAIFPLDEARSGGTQGLPPASTFLYVFEGATFADSAPAAFVQPAPGQPREAADLPLRFRVGFSHPPAAFGLDQIELGGSASPQSAVITPVSGSYGREFEVSVSDVMDEGIVALRQRNLPTSDGKDIPSAGGEIRLRFPPGTVLPLMAWDFSALQDPGKRDWAGQPIKTSRHMPLVAPSALRASHAQMLGNNEHYNNDGAGTWVGGNQMKAGSHFYAFDIQPQPGRALDIGRVECGFWAGGDLKATLEIWRGGERIANVPFEAEPALNTRGALHHNAGIRAFAQTAGIPALQGLRETVELRIVFSGLEEKGGIFGIGKLGNGVDDLSILGRIAR